MPRGWKISPRLLLAALMAVALGGCSLVTDYVIEPGQNSTTGQQAGLLAEVPASHLALHRSMFVADLHADTLLWDRDLLERNNHGHIDLPRMQQGGLGLQVFTLVTDTPRETANPDPAVDHCIYATSRNLAALLTVMESRPPRAWFNLRARAFDQAGKLLAAERRSRQQGYHGPELMVVRSAADLARLLARRAAGEQVVGGMLGVEGAHWVGQGDADEATTRAQVQELFNLGVRVFAPTHRFDNALGGASEGCTGRGLTEQGRWALLEAERLGMVVDLAHASSATLRDAVALLAQPVVVSHTGVQDGCEGVCYRLRNLSDDEIRLVAAKGGLIGAGYWPEAVGPNGMQDILRVMRQVSRALQQPAFKAAYPGLDPHAHLALGSDFDGAVETPIDVAGLPALTWAMARGGMTEAQLRQAAGGNACRLLANRLPGGSFALAESICK
jgi:microsomal dipeptidase-like Zn-dependent dipeptidase